MAMDEATLIKPSTNTYMLRATTSGEEHLLEGEMIIGRETECAIAIRSGHISRYHAKINVMRSGVYIEDLHSTNGTYVNGRRIKGRVLLSLGDEVTFDDIGFRVVSPGSGQEEQTLMAPARQKDTLSTRLAPGTARPARPAQPKADPALAKPSDAPKPAATPEAGNSPFDELANVDLEDQNPFDDPSALSDAPPATKAQPAHTPEPAPTPEPTPAPAPTSSLAPAAPSATPASPQQDDAAQANEGQDNTRMLSGTQLGQYVERNRSTHKDITLGSGPRLIIMTAPLRGKYFELDDADEGFEWQIGRGTEAQIRLTDRTISSDHARLIKLREGFKLQATHAKNGILVNGVEANQSFLGHDDKIQIGSTELVFKTDYSRASAQGGAQSLEEQSQNTLHMWIGAGVVIAAILSVLLLSKG